MRARGWIAAAVLLPLAAGAAEVSGVVRLTTRGVVSPAAGAVVWVPGAPAGIATTSPTLASRKKRFDPHVVAVRKGATLSFPNDDRIYHNVFSRTPGSEFDLGLYRGGQDRRRTFDSPGLVTVFCNIHSQMAAFVYVVDDGAFAVTGADGRYRLEVPPGQWAVHVWHEKGGEARSGVELPDGKASAAADFTLDATSYREAPHKNKHGEDYPPATRDDDRY